MNIEQIDEQRILISLCDEELELYSVSFDALGIGERNSEKMLKDLLSRAEEQTGISIKNKHILIEAMRFERGCLLLVTISEKSDRKTGGPLRAESNLLAFRFEDSDALLGCICALCTMKDFPCESSLLEYRGSYYLVISSSEPADKAVTNTMLEFGSAAGKGRCFISSLREHARIITPERAVETVGRSIMKKTKSHSL